MTNDEWNSLAAGDIIRNKLGPDGYTVICKTGRRTLILARYVEALNPYEWDLIAKAKFEMNE